MAKTKQQGGAAVAEPTLLEQSTATPIVEQAAPVAEASAPTADEGQASQALPDATAAPDLPALAWSMGVTSQLDQLPGGGDFRLDSGSGRLIIYLRLTCPDPGIGAMATSQVKARLLQDTVRAVTTTPERDLVEQAKAALDDARQDLQGALDRITARDVLGAVERLRQQTSALTAALPEKDALDQARQTAATAQRDLHAVAERVAGLERERLVALEDVRGGPRLVTLDDSLETLRAERDRCQRVLAHQLDALQRVQGTFQAAAQRVALGLIDTAARQAEADRREALAQLNAALAEPLTRAAMATCTHAAFRDVEGLLGQVMRDLWA
jgi:hypothetical protein